MGVTQSTYIYPYGETFHSKATINICLERVHDVLPKASKKGIINHQNCLGCITCLMQNEPPYLVFITLWMKQIRDGDSMKVSAYKLLYNIIFSSIYHKKYEYWLFAFAIIKSLGYRWPYMQICKMPNNDFWTIILSFDDKVFKYGNFYITRWDIRIMEQMQELIQSFKNKSVHEEMKMRIPWPKPTATHTHIYHKKKPILVDPRTYM